MPSENQKALKDRVMGLMLRFLGIKRDATESKTEKPEGTSDSQASALRTPDSTEMKTNAPMIPGPREDAHANLTKLGLTLGRSQSEAQKSVSPKIARMVKSASAPKDSSVPGSWTTESARVNATQTRKDSVSSSSTGKKISPTNSIQSPVAVGEPAEESSSVPLAPAKSYQPPVSKPVPARKNLTVSKSSRPLVHSGVSKALHAHVRSIVSKLLSPRSHSKKKKESGKKSALNAAASRIKHAHAPKISHRVLSKRDSAIAPAPVSARAHKLPKKHLHSKAAAKKSKSPHRAHSAKAPALKKEKPVSLKHLKASRLKKEAAMHSKKTKPSKTHKGVRKLTKSRVDKGALKFYKGSGLAVGSMNTTGGGLEAHAEYPESEEAIESKITVIRETLKSLERDLFKHRISPESYRKESSELLSRLHELEAKKKEHEKPAPQTDSGFEAQFEQTSESKENPKEPALQSAEVSIEKEELKTKPAEKLKTKPAKKSKGAIKKSKSKQSLKKGVKTRVVFKQKPAKSPPAAKIPRIVFKKSTGPRDLEKEFEEAKLEASMGHEHERLEIERLKQSITQKLAGKVDEEKISELNENLERMLSTHQLNKETVQGRIDEIESSRVLEGFMHLMEMIESQRPAKPEQIHMVPDDLRGLEFHKKKDRPEGKQKELEKKELVTDYDRILEEVRKKGSVPLEELAKNLEIEKKSLKEFLGVLENANLVVIDYPAIGSPKVIDPATIKKEVER